MIYPIFSNVLVKQEEAETKTESGIILTAASTEKPQKGKVIAVGEGFASEDGRESKMHIKVGMTVLFKKWGGNEVKDEGVDYLLIEQKDILAIIDDEHES